MATLTKNDRAQLRQKLAVNAPKPQWERRPIHEYLAFLRFVSRITPPTAARIIDVGSQWKL